MPDQIITVALTDCAADHDAVALIAPLGIDTEFQTFQAFEAPVGWQSTIVAETRTGQRSAVMVPADRTTVPVIRQRFAETGGGLPTAAFVPEGTPLARAAAELAGDARALADGAGGGLPGIAAIVTDTSARFDYSNAADRPRWYAGLDAVPQVACMAGNCIDINTYLVAALRAAAYRTTYLTCYFFDDDPNGIESGMHCWVRTEHDGVTQDWDIAHFKKKGRGDVGPILNPAPGKRFALAYGRDHTYRWRDLEIFVPTPSTPMWVTAAGQVAAAAPPTVTLTPAG